MGRFKVLLIVFAALALFVLPVSAGAHATKQTEDIRNQGGGGVYAPDAAHLTRTDNGLGIRVSMPTPAPGTYNYPPGSVAGAPEAFTGWAFVFNYPGLCSGGVCGFDDLGNTPAQGGVYNFAGHIVGGPHLTLTGHLSVGQSPFAGVPLQSPWTAEVHIAIAPHGQLDPALLPDQITTPIGSPPFWWVAIFD